MCTRASLPGLNCQMCMKCFDAEYAVLQYRHLVQVHLIIWAATTTIKPLFGCKQLNHLDLFRSYPINIHRNNKIEQYYSGFGGIFGAD